MVTIDTIIIFLNEKYKLSPILTVSIFDITNSKYSSEINHWVVKTKDNIYFLKRYPNSYLKKVHNEVSALEKVRNIINVPELIETSNKSKHVLTEEGVYILYKYIDGSNLAGMKKNKDIFFQHLCEIQNSLLSIGKGKKIL